LPEVPPPGAGVATLTWSVPTAVRLAAGMKVAIPLVPINIAVGREAPFHCTAEHGDKLLPFTVSGMGGPVNASIAAFIGEIELMAGEGRVAPVASAVTGNLREFEFVPGPLPVTVIATAAAPVPRNAVSAAVIAAVSCVALTKVVWRGEPFQLTTSPLAKPVPFTVRVKPVWLQYGVLFDEVVDAESDVMVGSTIGNDTELDVFVLDAGEATATWAVPTEAISAAGTTTLSCAGLVGDELTYVVANCVVTPPLVHCTTEQGRRFVPVAVRVAPEVPAVAVAGEMDVIVGAGGDEAETVKGKVFETAPKLET